MDKEHYRQIADFVAECAGDNALAVLYNRDDLDGGGLPKHALLLFESAGFTDRPYLSCTDDAGVRHSAFFLRDESGVLDGMIYVRRDFSGLFDARKAIGDFLRESGFEAEPPAIDAAVDDVGEFVRMHIERLVPGGLGQARAMSLAEKRKLLSDLSERGVFQIKKAVEHTMTLLDMSQATVYRYKKKAESNKDA